MPLRIKRAKVGQREAASSIIAALHQAKQELAVEMEANLKQLKAVLKETQRIARDMEAVLREARGSESTEESPPPTWLPPGRKPPEKSPGQKAQAEASGQAGTEEQGPDQEPWSPPGEAANAPEGAPPPWQVPPRARRRGQGANP